ncbi:daunorubicin C-13 ketoreductase DnrU [Seminavis robusta]|uniref:Daunorubicin C-13 ketoreductase DnrU n=1 Tax=Seminavis robusta TaxID=568900 RepID=A0A9N8EDE1_9STRA|nr:daunorubicin C-13 ketoreductase DnrU [Seminavis robusta]|eukprot:Sro926_g221080.1 daunorubicin C-13 ketoreductase DnrU (456) ;mRNA; r:33488-34950
MDTTALAWFFGLLLPPLVAVLYSIAMLSMYAGFCEWTVSEKLPSLAWRLGLLGGAAAITYSDRYATTHGSNISETSRMEISMMVIESALIWVLSFYFLLETRLEDIVGGTDPNGRVPKDCIKGKIVLVTGANAGIGKETARQLANLGAAKVILACRSPKRGQDAMEELRKNQQEDTMKLSQLMVLECDLGSFDSIRKAVDFLKGRQLEDIPKIDVLILNAGVMMNDHVMTKDGCETMMQANLLGHYLLTRMLLAKNMLKPNKKNPPRVLHLSSSTYQIAVSHHGGMDMDDLFCNKGKRQYSLFGQYAQSKLGNILFAKELARRYKDKLVSLAVHPGLVRTDVTRNMPFILYYGNLACAIFMKQLQKTVAQGAWCSVSGATISVDAGLMSTHELDTPESGTAEPEDSTDKEEPKGIPNGSYLQNGKVRQTDTYTYLEADARKLWDLSEKIVGLEQE